MIEQILNCAKALGRAVTRTLLLLYFVMKSSDTPVADKIMIGSALAYVIFHVDLISTRKFPVLGWIDEITSLAVAYKKVQQHVTPSMEMKAEQILDSIFGPRLAEEV